MELESVLRSEVARIAALAEAAAPHIAAPRPWYARFIAWVSGTVLL